MLAGTGRRFRCDSAHGPVKFSMVEHLFCQHAHFEYDFPDELLVRQIPLTESLDRARGPEAGASQAVRSQAEPGNEMNPG